MPAWVAAFMFIVAAAPARERPMDHNALSDFKSRIGFSKLAELAGSDGVRANWDDLPKVLGGITKGKRAYSDRANPTQSGEGTRDISWRLKEGSLIVDVLVSGSGPAGAQQAFLRRASATTRGKVPYDLRPGRLGDLAVCNPLNASGVVMWIYRNVYVVVDGDGTGIDLDPAVHAIQKFMEAHKVTRLADHLPVVEHVKVSKQQIHVGEEFQVTIVLGKQTPLDSVLTDFSEVLDPKTMEDKLELMTSTALSATFRAEKPGQTHIDVPVMDRKTLLSPPLRVTIDVLPAR